MPKRETNPERWERIKREAVQLGVNEYDMLKDQLGSPDDNFTGLLEQWDDRVFTHADHFRLHKFFGNGQHERFTTKDFAQAMVAAADALKVPNQRVIVYAVTATGRYQALVPSRWNHYAKLWLEARRGDKKAK